MTTEEFIAAYFGPGNGLTVEQAHRLPWLAELIARVEQRNYPFILPRLTSDGEADWYAIVDSPGSGVRLAEMLTAFVGPTYSSFSGRRVLLDVTDSVEAALHELGEIAYRLRVVKRSDGPRVRERIMSMLRLLAERPPEPHRLIRPTGRVLADFEFALTSGDDEASSALVQELRQYGHLSTANLACLEVLRRAAVEDWGGVLRRPDLDDLIGSRRPARVTAAIISALYNEHLRTDPPIFDVTTAVRVMESALPRFRPLFTAAPLEGDAIVLNGYMLAALADPAFPRHQAVDLIARAAGSEDATTRSLLDELTKRLESARDSEHPVTTRPLEEAVRLLANGYANAAMERAIASEPSSERCAVLLQSANDLGTLDAAERSLQAVREMAPEDWQPNRLSKTVRDLLAAAEGVVGSRSGVPPTSWHEWFTLLSEPIESRAVALGWAQHGSDEWSAADLTDPQAMASILSLLGSGPNVDLHAQMIPHLMRALERAPGLRFADSIRFRLIEVLVLGGDHTEAELVALGDLIDEAVRNDGLSHYAEVVGLLMDEWELTASPYRLRWAIDRLETLLDCSCPTPDLRADFLYAVMREAHAQRTSVPREVAVTLNELAARLGERFLLPGDSDYGVPDPLQAIAGRDIAIYTLTETTAQRARDKLEEFGCTVSLFHDHGASKRLTEAARGADLFVMVARSAKHPATDAIRVARGARPLLCPRGKGTSSILVELRRYALEEVTAAA